MKEKNYSYFNLLIRSSIVFIIASITIPLYSFLVILSWPFSLEKRAILIRLYLRAYLFILKLICRVDYQITGLENIPKNRKGIVMSKHQSTWETFFLPTIFHNPAIILKRELFWVPFFGWGLALSEPISINRKDKASAMQQVITKGKKCLDAGRWILIFPEGTRIPYGKIGNYRLGGARLAQATGYPIIPIAHNAGRYWPKRSFIKYPGTIKIVIGPPIYPDHKTPEELLAQTKGWIESTIKKLD